MTVRRLLPIGVPIAAALAVAALYAAGFTGDVSLSARGLAVAAAILGILVVTVFSAVHHAEVIAHRLGEPLGTLVLTLAVTIIEVALIASIMWNKDDPTLARDTVFAVIMIVCNGIVGTCIVIGAVRYREQEFQVQGASAYLIVLAPLSVFTLVLPNYTTTTTGPTFSNLQLEFISLVTILIYCIFLFIQTGRHQNYFQASGQRAELHDPPSTRATIVSAICLVVALVVVILLAKLFAVILEIGLTHLAAPRAFAGVVVALLVLLPEGVSAMRAARNDVLQKSLNLALGSSLATIGLTIPAVAIISLWSGKDLVLGLRPSETVLLVLTLFVSLLTFGTGRTNVLSGFVHLVVFLTFLFLVFAP